MNKRNLLLFPFPLFAITGFAYGPTLHWLEGNWSGNGGDINSTFTWTITLSYKPDDSFITLVYPSHSCGGTLEIITIESGKANCMEDVNYGLGQCSSGLKVLIKQEADGSITLTYYFAGTNTIKSSAKLKRIS